MERPKRGREVPTATRAALAAQLQASLTNRRVAEVLQVPIGCVSETATRVRRRISPSPSHRSGRPCLLNAGGVRHLQLVVLRSRRATPEQLTVQIKGSMLRLVGRRSARCYLHRVALLNDAGVTKPTRRHPTCQAA